MARFLPSSVLVLSCPILSSDDLSGWFPVGLLYGNCYQATSLPRVFGTIWIGHRLKDGSPCEPCINSSSKVQSFLLLTGFSEWRYMGKIPIGQAPSPVLVLIGNILNSLYKLASISSKWSTNQIREWIGLLPFDISVFLNSNLGDPAVWRNSWGLIFFLWSSPYPQY